MIPGALPERRAHPAANTGNGPPKNANESATWVKFTQLPRPLSEPHVFRARGKDVGTLVFRVLSSAEYAGALVAAHTKSGEMLGADAHGTVAFEELYLEQKGVNLIALACRQPESPDFPTFLTADDVRQNLTDDEIAVLLAAYAIFRRESGPIISELTGEELEAWFELVMKGASRFPLVRCSGDALADLVMYLASKLRAVTSTATSSPGSPPDASSTPTSESTNLDPEI